jgi:cholesterol transport system auxiliary component
MIKKLGPLRHLALVVLAVSLAAGCAKMFTEPPRPLYRLTAPADFPATTRHVAAQLAIAAPYAPAAIDTARIAMSRSPTSLDYLADGDWTDRASRLVQTALIETFENSRAFTAIGSDSLDLRPDFIIEGDLRHFEAVYDSPSAPPTVWVQIAVKLVKVPQHTILAETLISARQPASTNTTPDIVLAFDGAMAGAAKQIVAWVLANPGLSAPHK